MGSQTAVPKHIEGSIISLDLGGQQLGTLRLKDVNFDIKFKLDSHTVAGKGIATPHSVDDSFDRGSTHPPGDRPTIGLTEE